MHIAIVGAGPAGLRAAEVAATSGARVTIFEAKPSAGRKFLVAGKGGLNLTNAARPEAFREHFSGPEEFWKNTVQGFDSARAREWAEGLGVKTFVASTGRVYPEEMKAAPLLRRWIERLRALHVKFEMRRRWVGLERADEMLRLRFETPEGPEIYEAEAVVFALGGGSWPGTGSDGGWVEAIAGLGVAVAPLEPANCGWEAAWPPEFISAAEGQPLKNITASAGAERAAGELLVTAYGLEGGAIYQLTPALRAMQPPVLSIDLKPGVTEERLIARLGSARRDFLGEACRRWRLSEAARALLTHLAPRAALASGASLAAVCKALQIPLKGPRPLAEAISSAGGIQWGEIGADLMLSKMPGVFVAGEMIDWEAPTGGYLLHGCLATGALAGRGAAAWAHRRALEPGQVPTQIVAPSPQSDIGR